MSHSTSARWIVTTALTVFASAPMLHAQGAPDSTKMKATSAQRIHITKETGPGAEVVVARRDTVTVYRTRADAGALHSARA
ncbi:MAG TPA: hypothetical protein VN706_17695 [Gemmatimonadaceae bacterium]|nr:hypothetical protein [Gemmatimonadaceae bacterium]